MRRPTISSHSRGVNGTVEVRAFVTGRAPQGAINGRLVNAQQPSHLPNRLAAVDELASVADLLHGQFQLAPELHPAHLGGLHACAVALGDVRPFQLG